MAVSRSTNLDWYTTPFTEHLIYSMSSFLERQPETWKNWSSIWNKFTRVYVPCLRKISLRGKIILLSKESFWEGKTKKNKKPLLRNQKLLKSWFLFPFPPPKTQGNIKNSLYCRRIPLNLFLNVSWQLQPSQSTFYVKNISICSNYVINFLIHFRSLAFPQICTKLPLRNKRWSI